MVEYPFGLIFDRACLVVFAADEASGELVG